MGSFGTDSYHGMELYGVASSVLIVLIKASVTVPCADSVLNVQDMTITDPRQRLGHL